MSGDIYTTPLSEQHNPLVRENSIFWRLAVALGIANKGDEKLAVDFDSVLRSAETAIGFAVSFEKYQANIVVLQALQNRIGRANEAKGFHEHGKRVIHVEKHAGMPHFPSDEDAQEDLRAYWAERLLLIVSEVTEAHDEIRSGHPITETRYPTSGTNESKSELDGLVKLHKPEGVPSELADVVIRTFDLAHEAGIDLASMIEEKLAYNATRPFKHGRKL